jgi:hypothetical protein
MWDETAKVIEVIWVRMESEYFCEGGWTREGKSPDGAGFENIGRRVLRIINRVVLPGFTRQSIIF